MPEAYHRCLTCAATHAEHEDPEIRTCATFAPRTTQLVEDLRPDLLEQAARTVAQVDGQPERAVLLSDVRSVLDELSCHRVGGSVASILSYLQGQAEACTIHTAGLRDLLGSSEARLIEANEALECWGAFDYLLLELAGDFDAATGCAPIGVVRSLMWAAWRRGLAGDDLGIEFPLPEGMGG